jgi:CheY-like chemotaxis protein
MRARRNHIPASLAAIMIRMKKRVLSISYDSSLLATRQWILETAGYEVSSALGFAEALDVCKTRQDFDLVLMGHSMPQKDKVALFEALKAHCKAPLLTILRQGESMPQANYAVNANDGPEALLEAVKKALESQV